MAEGGQFEMAGGGQFTWIFHTGYNEYPKMVFDKLETGATVCNSTAKPFNTDFGTANYYSAKNPALGMLNEQQAKYIPNATGSNLNEGYAFTETRLSPDGRVAAQSGVGIVHQIGSGHETKYYYEPPGQEELDALFGTDAGVASHYSKNIVRDANGQFSVSYVDMHGRTVATALAGEVPKAGINNPIMDTLESMNQTPTVKQLIDKETNRVVGNSIISSKPFTVLKDSSTYSFNYTLTPGQLSLVNCSNQPVCYDCMYQVKFTVSSDCDKQLVYVDSLSNFTLGQYINHCNGGNANQGFSKTFSLILGQGSYVVTKELKLSSEARNAYRDTFLLKDSCRKFIDFYTRELDSLQASANCGMTCESCRAAIGNNFAGFKGKYAAEMNIPDSAITAAEIIQLQAAFNEAYANCQKLCTQENDGMDLVRSIREMMLLDVTPPSGQFAKLNQTTGTNPIQYQNQNYNIFKTSDPSNILENYGNSSSTIDYKRPIRFDADDRTQLNIGSFFNEFGQPETFNPLAPLSADQFTDSFQTSWANQLLVHHPEFRKLQFSENELKTSFKFEADLQNDSTWEQAKNHDYIINLIDNDPFFTGVGAAYISKMKYGNWIFQNQPPAGTNLDVNPVIHGILGYLVPHTMAVNPLNPLQTCPNAPQYDDTPISMWQVALGAVFCYDKANGDVCNINESDLATKAGCTKNPAHYQPQNNFSEGCITDRDWAWKIFRNLYLVERRKLISAYLNSVAPSFSSTYPNSNIPPYQLRFINHANPAKVFENVGLDGSGDIGSIITGIGNNIGNGNLDLSSSHDLEQKQYDSVCLGYVNIWQGQLLTCPQIKAIYDASLTPPVPGGPNPTVARIKWVSDSTWLMDRLRSICRNGADETHFLGSSSIKASAQDIVIDGVHFREFPDVVKEFLATRLTPTNGSNITQPYTEQCYPWLITVPKPYDKQVPLANSYVLTKPSDCECQRINAIRTEWTNSGFAGTFSAYMQYQHGTYISNEQLDALYAMCNGNYTCKMFAKPIALPPALQCPAAEAPTAPAKTCITCQDYQSLKTEFFTITNQHAPFAHPQNSTEVSYNYAFANYANYKTGFSKRWTEYVAFGNTCDSVNPPIRCSSLDSTLNDFLASPAYLNNPVGLPCYQAFVNYFNSHYGVVYNYNQWMQLFAQCGNIPDVCKPRVTCESFKQLIDDFYNQYGVQVFRNPSCQALFVNYINSRLNSNYTYAQLNAIYRYTCSVNCNLDICSFPNASLLTKVYNDFKALYPQPWTLADCQGTFVSFFNTYFGLTPPLTWQEILAYYPIIDRECTPELFIICNAPYSCDILNNIVSRFYSTYNPVSQLPNCQDTFALFFNTILGTHYTYSQIAAIYLQNCGTALVVCQPVYSCAQLQAFADSFNIYQNNGNCPGWNQTGYDCRTCFVPFFNSYFNTNYSTWQQIMAIFQSSNCLISSLCGTTGRMNVIISSEGLTNFLADFKSKFPDPATQLAGECENYFAAQFNSHFETQYSFIEIAAYYLEHTGIALSVCETNCSRMPGFITAFNTRYSSLKLPNTAREELFTFEYNKAFLNGAKGNNDGGIKADETGGLEPVANTDATGGTAINFVDIQNAMDACGIPGFNVNTIATISLYDPQVLLSLKQVYYVMHPNGLTDNCQEDFSGWFNLVMKTQFSYQQLLSLYNTVCGNNSGYICENVSDDASAIAVYVNLMGNTPPATMPPMLCGLNDPGGMPVDIDDNPCKDLPKIAFHVALEKYELYLDSLRNVFDTAYYNKCMAAKDLESFTMSYNSSEYHYTLYYYDQAGNLVKTVPPAGVVKLTAGQMLTVKNYRAAVAAGQSESSLNQLPAQHNLITKYLYNTLNQVVVQQTPDAYISNFFYDRLGRLVVSQNAKQAVTGSGGNTKYSYTLYDDLGRIKEVGQLTSSTQITQTITRNDGNAATQGSLANWLNNKPAEQITRTFYDKSYIGGNSLLCPLYLCQKNLRNRVSYTGVYATGTPGSINEHIAGTFYSYDIHGNVDTLLQDYGNSVNASNVMNSTPNRFKKMVYDYDLISGKVNTVTYQPDYYLNNTWVKPPDQFTHRYTYDAENRITDVETSVDKLVWEKDARYNYYKHGPLARLNLGEQQVQGLDYIYTLQGWLKGVNSSSVYAGIADMGQDGRIGSANSNIARDAYGFSLNYFSGDYKPIGSNTSGFVQPFIQNTFALTNTDNRTVAHSLYNGNIAAMAVNIPKLGDAQVYGYRYDQLNRIVSMDAFTGLDNVSNLFTPLATASYKERVSYDANGNIKTYLRNGDAARQTMDNLTYSYKANTNQLDKVVDAVTDVANGLYDKYNDIKRTQPNGGQGQVAGNYQYDAIGNLVSDVSEGISNIGWTVYGKISQITKTDGTNIVYTYDASGNRISKTVTAGAPVSGGPKTTWYVRDASGNVMSVYTKESAVNNGDLTLSETHLYGSSRLGIFNRNVNVQNIAANPTGMYNFERGNKFFELSNHLGNVLVTVSDKKIQHTSNTTSVDYYLGDVVTANDFYPFGMQMPGRKFTQGNSKYRYSINGQEKDGEINENITTAMYWEYDSRIGRRLNVDPKGTVSISPYATFKNNPIYYTDPLGDTTINGQKMEGANAASATTLQEVSVIAFRKNKIDANRVIKIDINVKCHTTNADVANAFTFNYAREYAKLDKAHGQVDFPLGWYDRNLGGLFARNGRATDDNGYLLKKPHPVYQGGTINIGMKGAPIPGAVILRNFTYSSESVAAAAKQLANGISSVSVLSRAEAEELFLTQFVTRGYKNTTGFTPFEMKDKFLFPNGKASTYHWDLFDTQHGGIPHLQIHDEAGRILRIFFNK